jgi:hypothetical protein
MALSIYETQSRLIAVAFLECGSTAIVPLFKAFVFLKGVEK